VSPKLALRHNRFPFSQWGDWVAYLSLATTRKG
jgi:hypothetical protein